MAKNNERIWKLLRLWPIAAAIILFVAGYTTLGSRVTQQEKQGNKTELKADANEKAIIRIETKLDYLIKGVDEIRAERRK